MTQLEERETDPKKLKLLFNKQFWQHLFGFVFATVQNDKGGIFQTSWTKIIA